ncbi:GNAT family N-acetyltransferase [Kitasatospora cineracea]|uniref:Acetyltransferase (GNAT) family protein n=1 Tax=Kitasatospora cineracea TaxID=88074 RepID=A0A3N4S0L5_9ACTN|nr:GNAT family N-acetyltransferase [Kitasatospora cineracea]RPE36749.1 acetyltransferase (GNAT) family protein [Kitasatospora cineracea]
MRDTNHPLASGSEAVLARLETYYDAVPRFSATTEEHGPFTLFVRTGEGWHYYARPTLDGPGAFTAEDVERVRARQREVGAPESFEWVHETTPGLRAVVEAGGLEIHEHPLLVLDLDGPSTAATGTAAAAADGGPEVRVLAADDPLLPAAITLPHLAFAESGTLIGTAGPEQLVEAVKSPDTDAAVARMAGRISAGRTVLAAVVGPDGAPTASGCHQPIDGVSEIVAVATLPALRRQGLARRLTSHLVEHARTTGVRTLFLSASDDAVARIYESVGFRRIATALIAEPPAEG